MYSHHICPPPLENWIRGLTDCQDLLISVGQMKLIFSFFLFSFWKQNVWKHGASGRLEDSSIGFFRVRGFLFFWDLAWGGKGWVLKISRARLICFGGFMGGGGEGWDGEDDSSQTQHT